MSAASSRARGPGQGAPRLVGGLAVAGVVASFGCRPSAPAAVAPDEPVVAVEPAADRPDFPDEPFRASAPAPGPVPPFREPAWHTGSLGPGATYTLVADDTPAVSLTIEFELGAIDDPAGKRGLASLCTDLIGLGPAGTSPARFAERKADAGATIAVWTATETSGLTVTTTVDGLQGALALALELLTTPALDPGELERLRRIRLAGLEQQRGSPASLAGRLLPKLVYGASHPLGRLEDERTLGAITAADCRAFVGRWAGRPARVFASGPVTAAQLTQASGDYFAARARVRPRPRDAIRPAQGQVGIVWGVHVPKAAQSMVMVAHPGPARLADDYEATRLALAIYGGSFSSRLNMNLREDKGVTYGARAGITYYRSVSHTVASAQVDTPHTGLAVREIEREARLLRASPPSQAEFDRERDGALESLPARFATARAAIDAAREVATFGLDLGWYAAHRARLAALELDAVGRAARDHLRERDVAVLVVGDREVIEPQLAALVAEGVLGLRALHWVDADGAPVR